MEQYSRKYPNHPVKIDVIGGDYFDTLNLQLAAGSMAEAILFEGNLFQAHYAAGFFPDITDAVNKLGFSLDDYWVLPTGWLPWEGALYQANGRLHGLPFQGGMNGIVFNVDLFDSNGVGQPAEDWDWNDAMEASRQLTDADNDQYGMWAPTSDQFGWGPMLWSNGVEYWFNEQGESQFDAPGSVEALTWVHGTMHTEGVAFTQEVRQRVAGEFGDPFSAGKVGIWPGGRVYSTGFGIPRIKDRFTWSVGPMYVSPTRVTRATGGTTSRTSSRSRPNGSATLRKPSIWSPSSRVRNTRPASASTVATSRSQDRGRLARAARGSARGHALAQDLRHHARTPHARLLPLLGRVPRRARCLAVQALDQRGWSRGSGRQHGQRHQRRHFAVQRLGAHPGLVHDRSPQRPAAHAAAVWHSRSRAYAPVSPPAARSW